MPRLDIERVEQITVLGIIINNRLSASDHITHLIKSGARLQYAVRELRVHGLPLKSLNDVYWATVQGSSYMLPLYGLDSALRGVKWGSALRGVKWGSTCFFADVGNLHVMMETWCLKTCVLMQKNSFLTDLLIIHITYCIDCYHHPQQRHNDTILEAAGTHSMQLPEHHTSLLDSITFSLECFIRTVISKLQNSTV